MTDQVTEEREDNVKYCCSGTCKNKCKNQSRSPKGDKDRVNKNK